MSYLDTILRRAHPRRVSPVVRNTVVDPFEADFGTENTGEPGPLGTADLRDPYETSSERSTVSKQGQPDDHVAPSQESYHPVEIEERGTSSRPEPRELPTRLLAEDSKSSPTAQESVLVPAEQQKPTEEPQSSTRQVRVPSAEPEIQRATPRREESTRGRNEEKGEQEKHHKSVVLQPRDAQYLPPHTQPRPVDDDDGWTRQVKPAQNTEMPQLQPPKISVEADDPVRAEESESVKSPAPKISIGTLTVEITRPTKEKKRKSRSKKKSTRPGPASLDFPHRNSFGLGRS